MDIKFTKNESHALRDISAILLGYLSTQQEAIETKKEVAATAQMLVDIYQALDAGETEFGFSRNVSKYLVHLINFWYEGAGRDVFYSDKLQGNTRKMFTKHYNLVPYIIKKLNT